MEENALNNVAITPSETDSQDTGTRHQSYDERLPMQDEHGDAIPGEHSPAVTEGNDEEGGGASPTSTTVAPTFRRSRSLRIDTTAPDPASETSSIVPTSARLSIASTTHPLVHRSLSQALNPDPNRSVGQDAIPGLLENILQNPGWSAAMQTSQARRQRGNSLQSMRSLVPTLPPYEEYRNHVLVPGNEAGSSLPRFNNGGVGEKSQAQSSRVAFAEPEVSTEQPQPSHDPASEGEEAALIAHYSRVVRTIDSRYTAEVARLTQEKAKAIEDFEREAARMRNEIDATYRGVLKERDKAVERAREEAASRVEELEKEVLIWKDTLEKRIETIEASAKGREDQLRSETERVVEKARHEVEDVWERRWRDRMALVDEEAESRVKKRDGEWLAFLDKASSTVHKIAKDEMISAPKV